MTLIVRQTLSDLADTFMPPVYRRLSAVLARGCVLPMTEEVIPQPMGAVFLLLTFAARRSCHTRIRRMLETQDQRD